LIAITTILNISCADDAEFRSNGRRGQDETLRSGSNSESNSNSNANGNAFSDEFGDAFGNPFGNPSSVGNDFDGNSYKDKWQVDLDGDSGKQKFMLTIEPNTNMPVDYLFVVDNSTSMESIIHRMQRGFKEIAERGEFPKTAKIGVISTSVDEASKPGSKIVGYKALANRASIARSERTNKGTYPGCENGWFSPSDKDARNQYCLTSATEFKLYGTKFEAGLSAVDNLFEAHKSQQLFRKGALVNVVFFSDTHDVGAPRKNITNKASYDSLVARRNAYTVNGFLEKARQGSSISSIKFHGVVPQSPRGACGNDEANPSVYSYSKLIEASDGKQVHCSENDYVSFISGMVQNSKVASKIVKLPDDFAGEIAEVKIDGSAKKYLYDKARNSILIRDVSVYNNKDVKVEVIVK
jgi:hypothetical protein